MTDDEARDETNAMLNVAWELTAASIVGAAVEEIRWKGRKSTEEPQGYWARVSHRIISQTLVSMVDDGPGASKRRYETLGQSTVQMFAPMSDRNGSNKGFLLASMMRDAFRAAGVNGNVWFRNPHVDDLPDDGSSHRWNVISDFQYDTIV